MGADGTRGPVLVFGATGRQGGAVTKRLREAGWEVRAATRNPDGAGARALAARGAVPVRADLDDPTTLPAALAGCHAVFSVQNYWEKGVGYDGEVRQGRALVDAAVAAGVRHFVQSSVAGGAGAPADAPEHFRCKWAIEDHVRASGLGWTFVRTVFFCENFADPANGDKVLPVLAGSLPADLPFHVLAVDDIARMVVRALEAPDRYLGVTVDLASDVVTLDEMRAVITRVTGRATPRWWVPHVLLRLMNAEFAAQLRWNRTDGWRFTMDEVRVHLPEPTSFEAWFRGWWAERG